MSSDEQNRVEPEGEQDLEVDGAAAEEVRGGADDKPTESLSLNYTKVKMK